MEAGINTWIYATLSADSEITSLVAGRIYAEQAPQGAACPLIIFSRQDSQDANTVGGQGGVTTATYQIKAVGEGGAIEPLAPIADRIYSLFHAKKGAGTGVTILSCVREGGIGYPETFNGKQYRHYGALYSIMAQLA